MSAKSSAPRVQSRTILFALLLLLAGAVIGAFAVTYLDRAEPTLEIEGKQRAAIEAVVRSYILAHPEILPEAIDNLRKRDSSEQIAGVRRDVEKPFPGAVLGNPEGTVTLVQFSDYGCTFCRQSVVDVEALTASNPDLQVVVRELPILGPASLDAAKMALAAAKQGKYAEFHKAMFMAGPPTNSSISAAANAVGLDLARARRVAADPHVIAELRQNTALAGRLKFSGTPSWVAGDELLSGAVGLEQLEEAVQRARK